jgi:hypothetical protein
MPSKQASHATTAESYLSVFDRERPLSSGLGPKTGARSRAFVESRDAKFMFALERISAIYQLTLSWRFFILSRGNSSSVPTLVIHNLKPTFFEHRQTMIS